MRAFRWQALSPFQPQLEVLWAFQLCYHCAIKPGCGDTYLSSQTVTVILKINPVSLCMGFYEKMLGWSEKGCLPMQALCFPMKASWASPTAWVAATGYQNKDAYHVISNNLGVSLKTLCKETEQRQLSQMGLSQLQLFVGHALASTVTWSPVWSFKSKWIKTKSEFKVSSWVAAVTFCEFSNCRYWRWLATPVLEDRHRTFPQPYKAQLAGPRQSALQKCDCQNLCCLTPKGHVPQKDFLLPVSYQSSSLFSKAADKRISDGLGVLSSFLLRKWGLELSF